MKKDLNILDNAMALCNSNGIKVSHSHDLITKKYIIEVYFKNKLYKKYSDKPVDGKELNKIVTKTWIFYAKKL